MHSFTTEDLLEFLYQETSPEKTAAIKAALENDWILSEKLELLSNTSQQIEKINYSPSKKTIDYILNYAKNPEQEISETA